jgi:hypothetical protein
MSHKTPAAVKFRILTHSGSLNEQLQNTTASLNLPFIAEFMHINLALIHST